MFVPRTLSTRRRTQCPRAPLACLPHAAPRRRAVCGRSGVAVWAKGSGWVWEEKAKGKGLEGGEREKQNEEEHAHEPDEPPFALHDITLSIPRGRSPPLSGAWGAAGRVCCRASLGDALHRHQGQVGIWRRDNVLFGQPFEADRYWRVIEDSYLLPDLQLLTDGDLTERREGDHFIGRVAARLPLRMLSGQTRHVARALYYGADVVIFDDPLSAVDANVGKALFRSVIQGLVMQGTTVLLVTHAQCDYIYTLDGGRIAGAGTYPELIARGGEFARLDREFRWTKADDAGGKGAGAGAGEDGDGDEAQVHVVHRQCSAQYICSLHFQMTLTRCITISVRMYLTEDHTIVAKRTELAQRMKMLEGVRKDLMAFEK
ncbi:P-loop containing nucleoside triphosphate hydrolase protein [Mycena leptocephala]|nr:P-loop containing nucleoside triphosphate hydrolase protein [Mycena leptocephala]